MNAKRWIAIFLAVVLTLSLIASVLPTVFAAEAYTIGLHDGNKNANITVEAGGTVEAYLYLAGNPGILSAGVLINCPDGVKITKVSSALSGHDFKPTWQYSQSYAVNPYLVWMLAPTGTNNKGLVTYNGNISKITLSLSKSIAEGNYTIRLTAPKDKNLTAQTSGGVIVAESNRYVTGIAVSNFTVTVKTPECSHNWGAWTEEAALTCETDGKQVRECSLCQLQQEKTIPATGHKMGSWISVETPTCTKPGKEKQECQNKNCDHSQTRAVEKLGHKFATSKIVNEPTCTKAGQKAGQCERCDQNTTETIPAIGHDFGQPEIIRQPTAEKPGLKQSKCSRCGEVKKEEIPCIPAETTEVTTGETTEATTIPENTTGAETQPGATLPEETLPVSATLEETLPVSGAPDEAQPVEAVLKMVIILAGILLLGVLTLIVVLAVRSKKK